MYSLSEIRVALLAKASAAARAALPIFTSVCSIFKRPETGLAANGWDL